MDQFLLGKYMIYWFKEIYGIEIHDADTIEIKLKWGPNLEYMRSTFLDIDGDTIFWKKYYAQNFPEEAINYFNKIVKNKAFL